MLLIEVKGKLQAINLRCLFGFPAEISLRKNVDFLFQRSHLTEQLIVLLCHLHHGIRKLQIHANQHILRDLIQLFFCQF